MKALYSEKYYMDNWDRFIKRVPGNTYINMEADFDLHMKGYIEAGLPDEALDIVRKMVAKKVVDSAMEIVLKQLDVIKRVEAGKATFGYTTERQEDSARYNYRVRFDFNCLQIRIFKEKHLS